MNPLWVLGSTQIPTFVLLPSTEVLLISLLQIFFGYLWGMFAAYILDGVSKGNERYNINIIFKHK